MGERPLAWKRAVQTCRGRRGFRCCGGKDMSVFHCAVVCHQQRRRDYYYVEEKEEGGRTFRLYAFAYVIGTRLTVRYVFYALKLYISNTILIVISAVDPFHKRQEIHYSYSYSIKITTLSTNSLEKKICRFPHT